MQLTSVERIETLNHGIRKDREKRMCNCIQEMISEITEKGFENVEAPIELLSGRLYLEFTGNKKGQKKKRTIPVLLSKCPICGEEYENHD